MTRLLIGLVAALAVVWPSAAAAAPEEQIVVAQGGDPTPLDPHFKGKDRAFIDRNPVGTGPYRFVRWDRDERLELGANERWWGGAPKVKTLIFRPIPEHAVRVAALQAGEVDVAVNVPPHLLPVIET